MTAPALTNLLDYDAAGLTGWFAERGERGFRATQIIKWVHQQGVVEFDQMSNLSRALRDMLAAESEIRPPEIITERLSQDGTRKWLMRVDNGNSIETVFIPEGERGTLCVSSQVGCPLDCAFCATARQGFSRNLSTAEIIGQVWQAARALGQTPKLGRHITNVVMMGMGEPLLNFDNVVPAMRLMLDDHAYNLARKRVTLSTAGVVPGIDKLAEHCPVSLAISLHATNDELRDRLVPINRSYPIAELLAACKRYSSANPHAEITFEYVMLKGVNDSLAEAKALIRLLQGLPAKVNLIPFNPFEDAGFERSEDTAINAFRERLQRSGIVTVTRKTRGDDIAAACGQLVGQVQAKARRHQRRAAMPATEETL
ncbi:MAG: 23S rRNA (adenine(2503)-C(2))-methyltransferase RlmN [Gammaproteobacteria bacterium]